MKSLASLSLLTSLFLSSGVQAETEVTDRKLNLEQFMQVKVEMLVVETQQHLHNELANHLYIATADNLSPSVIPTYRPVIKYKELVKQVAYKGMFLSTEFAN